LQQGCARLAALWLLAGFAATGVAQKLEQCTVWLLFVWLVRGVVCCWLLLRALGFLLKPEYGNLVPTVPLETHNGVDQVNEPFMLCTSSLL
jgi:hypothetical protein